MKLFKRKIKNETLFNKGSSNEMYLLQHQTIVQLVYFCFFLRYRVFVFKKEKYKSQNVLHPVFHCIFLNCENAYLHKMIDKLKMQLLNM